MAAIFLAAELRYAAPDLAVVLQRFRFFFFFFLPGLDGLPLPTTPSTKKARAGQLNKKDQIAKSFKVPVLINAAHLRRGIRGAMRDGPTSTYAHCS